MPDEEPEDAKCILIGERELPKWGGGADVYIAKIAEAQAKLGAAIDRETWTKQRAAAKGDRTDASR